jgi:hypothetical protein
MTKEIYNVVSFSNESNIFKKILWIHVYSHNCIRGFRLYCQTTKLRNLVPYERVRVRLFNATFNNISAIMMSCIGGGNRSAWINPQTCRKSLTNFITQCCIEYTSPWEGFEVTTLVVINADSTGSCKSNYHTITTMTTSTLRNAYIATVSKYQNQEFKC